MPVLFFFNDTATTEIYTLSLHDALPISPSTLMGRCCRIPSFASASSRSLTPVRSEEHTSELQSLTNLVCRLLLEKKKLVTIEDERALFDERGQPVGKSGLDRSLFTIVLM